MFLLSHYLEFPNRMTGGLKTQTQDIFLLNKKHFQLKIQKYLQNKRYTAQNKTKNTAC